MYPFDSESSSRRHSPDSSGSNTPAPNMTLARGHIFTDKVSLPSIGSMFASAPSDDIYEARRNSLPYPGATRSAAPAGASQWFGLATHDRVSTGSNASTGSPNSPTSSSPSFTAASTYSNSTAPTTVKSSPGTSPFSDRLALPTGLSLGGREWSAPLTIPVPPSDNVNGPLGAAQSASPAPTGDSPPAASVTAAPARRRGKLPKHVTETLRTWLLSHADHPYPTEEEKKMLCNVTGLTLSQVSNWMINARRRILVPASKQQAAINATTGPYIGMPRSAAATDLARANRVSMNIPHQLPTTLSHQSPLDYPPTHAYNGLPGLSQAGDLHISHRGYPPLAAGRSYAYPGPATLHAQSYYGSGLSAGPTLANYVTGVGLTPIGTRYYGEHDPYSAAH